ncbi:ABC transporter ATP-binding protein [Thalassovita mediterranea]|uniref:Iron(3+)-hydroxamate import ATP-binding protein FhuC n=1 Tax=Thalassovita mediterranea TaxID=340021 RepID=A0A0P1H8R3_9RHOB|nr:ABC transporter ATP-binding protein [Thalassovita mediterranea]CUH83329.1 Iron(3+)-hydroxamate import ATP-binding protein FhuC [Thalassovita mediterranea]SIS33984.1 iron complex transport system ATP-binding protein [Thalassovita mediterranea]
MTLSVETLQAGYGRTRILKDVSIPAMTAGSFVGLIGPNAAGKSTLFKSLAGLVTPTAGRITLGGDDITHLPRRDRVRRIAYMPQAYGCNALLTVFETVLLALKQTTGWRVQGDNLDRVADTLSALGLSHLADRGIADLSGGQAQMVAVAQTIVRAPEVILLDEPTSALDLHHQLSILTSVRSEMQRRQPVIMAALHDLNLAAKFCDRLVLLRAGEVLADGTPADILALPEIGETYRVDTDLEHTRRGALYVDARLPAAASAA